MSQNTARTSADPTPVADAIRGHLSEIFASVQGEGPLVGQRQVFVRTAGCTATCSWCDTLASKVQTRRCVVRGDETRVLANPVGTDEVLREVDALARRRSPLRTVSVTGGEPLEQPQFVAALARGLRRSGMRVYLETNGLHARALEAVVADIDVLAMDIKLPSAVGGEVWEDHRRFLNVLADSPFCPTGGTRARKTVFAKLVVDGVSGLREIEEAARLLARADRRIPLVLQPESSVLLSQEASRVLALIDDAQRRALRLLDDVRVMPQCHRILGVR